MPNGQVPGQKCQTFFGKKIIDAPHTYFGMDRMPLGSHNAGAFLPTVLQGVEPQVGQFCRLRMAIDADDGTFIVKLIILVHRVSPHRQNSCRCLVQR